MTDINCSNPELLEMCREHFNEPFILNHEIARCIGYEETGEDCYIICRNSEGKIRYSTCVGGYIWLDFLKNQGIVYPNNPKFEGEVWNDFVRLDSSLSLNRCPKEPEFILKINHDYNPFVGDNDDK